jgi:exodeoxyribonuclease VII large subunit
MSDSLGTSLSANSPVGEKSVEKPETKVLSVEELNRQIRQLIEGELSLVWVQGEISNFKAHTSGHYYFSLKDAKSQISAVMFRGHNSRLKFKPTDGLEVIVRGRVTVYEPRGNYQITAEMMEPVGAGALQKAYEQLKDKLKKEGLFDQARKRPLPALPRHIAIVTSPTGAAIRDMINVLSRRNKAVQITLIPTIVQGEAAAPKIVEALRLAYSMRGVDAIILGRGGGSIEDMWCFNDERVARTIVESPVPLISAVGHEIDFTIADFVADLRAPTPSAAAELVVKNSADLSSKLLSLERLLILSMQKILKSERQRFQNWSSRLVDPKRKLQDFLQRNDELITRLHQAVFSYFEKSRLELKVLSGKMIRPDQVIDRLRSKIQVMNLKMKSEIEAALEAERARLDQRMAVLESLSPLKVVERGYSVTKIGKKLVKSANQVHVGDEIRVQLMKGELTAKVMNIEIEK